jgi:hypothetical protein
MVRIERVLSAAGPEGRPFPPVVAALGRVVERDAGRRADRVLHRVGGPVRVADVGTAFAPPRHETVLGGLAVVAPSREEAVYGQMWCRRFARRLGIGVPRIRWYSGPEWTPFGTCPTDEPGVINIRANLPMALTISTIGHELVHRGGGDEQAAQKYERRVAPLIEARFGPVQRPRQRDRARLNAAWRRSVAHELVIV